MSQPSTTLQKPKPDSTADRNLSLCRYLPRSTPSMSLTATLMRLASLRRISSTMRLALVFFLAAMFRSPAPALP